MQGSVWVCGQEDGPSSQTAPAATPNAKAVSPGGQFMGIPLDELVRLTWCQKPIEVLLRHVLPNR